MSSHKNAMLIMLSKQPLRHVKFFDVAALGFRALIGLPKGDAGLYRFTSPCIYLDDTDTVVLEEELSLSYIHRNMVLIDSIESFPMAEKDESGWRVWGVDGSDLHEDEMEP